MIMSSTLLCLSLVIFFEARGEPIEGQKAVAQVVINRSIKNKTTICEEVYKHNQFSWTKKKYKIPSTTDKTWLHVVEIARWALQNKSSIIPINVTFFKHKKCTIKLAYRLKKYGIIGNHMFFTQN